MKNITRRGFLQLTAATALVCAAAPLTGCGKKNKGNSLSVHGTVRVRMTWRSRFMMTEPA